LFRIRSADSPGQRSSDSLLINRMYAARGRARIQRLLEQSCSGHDVQPYMLFRLGEPMREASSPDAGGWTTASIEPPWRLQSANKAATKISM